VASLTRVRLWSTTQFPPHCKDPAPAPAGGGRAGGPAPRRCRRIFVEGNVVIPPHGETDVSTRSPLLTPNLVGPGCIVETHQVRPGLYVGRTLLPSSHRDAKVRVCNTTNKPVSVADGTCIGNLSAVTVRESKSRPACAVKNSENANSETANSLTSNAKTTDEVLGSLMSKLPDDLS